MPNFRLIAVIGICFLAIQTLTYLAYRQPETTTSLPLPVPSPPLHDPSPPPPDSDAQNDFVRPDVPPEAPAHIRRKIWQISKRAPMGLESEHQNNLKRWNELNPKWRHEILTDKGSDEYVRDRFAHDPDIVETYTGLTDGTIRAEFFRYLCLYGDGGVYSDIDTEVLKPIEHWIPQEYQSRTSAVVGIESDTFGLGPGSALLDVQLCTWTIMSKANHRLLEITIRNVVKAIHDFTRKNNVSLTDFKPTSNEAQTITGPAQLTRSTWQYLTEMTGEEFTWQRVTRLKEPLFAHDVLILPVTSFANGQAHSDARPPTDPSALVHHQLQGSSKSGSGSWKAMKESEKGNW